MNVVLGIVLIVASFVASAFVRDRLPFGGLINPAALVLLILGPPSVSLISHSFAELSRIFGVARRAFAYDRSASLDRASEELAAIARALRETRFEDARRAADSATNEHVRRLAPHALARQDAEELRAAVASATYRFVTDVRAADELFQHLGRLSPAFGMIGTILGLVDLFAHMRDGASLGPGMAMALLATLYGLVLCYCCYMPIAVRIRGYLASGVGEQRLVERALVFALDGRPIGEVRAIINEGSR
ncbi:MAG: MotA/TolQ/ExbB proton channel family protein [Deltaproteobacteria bacterium]|nr:MotA/TolQ/ExbB proton channel family protein [Deltaproteobacteria bacterium]